jgi:rubrerythrin
MPTKKIKRLIDGAMMDETQARNYYSKMISSTKDKEEKRKLIEIRNDEIDHFKILKRMKKD